MNGILVVCKPPGMTSHDVVGFLRRVSGERRIGHTGTLDPGAAGVLPLCLGNATRVSEYLLDEAKSYRFEVRFGEATATADAEGEPVATAPAEYLDEAAVRLSLERFVGEIEQRAPAYSAVKVGGQPLYRRARRGEEVTRPIRRVRVYRLELLAFRPGSRPAAMLEVDCSRGTYVRSLAEDLAGNLGTVGHLSFLLRLAAGPFRIDEAFTLEEIGRAAGRGSLADLLRPAGDALPGAPVAVVDDRQAEALRAGRNLEQAGVELGPEEGRWRLELPGGQLVAVGRRLGRGKQRLEKVLADGGRR